MKNIFIAAIASAMLLVSCTKEVTLPLKTVPPTMVIEGNITNEQGPYTVLLRKTVDFNNKNSYPPVTGAAVTIADDAGFSETLKETSPGVYQTTALVGTPGRTYTLKVLAEGKNYNATSTMPQPVPMEDVKFELFTSKGDSGKPEYSALPVFTDPADVANSYRFIMKVNGKLNTEYFVLNDNTFNGQKNEQILFDPGAEINAGDTVELEFRCTDRNNYLYFFTLSQFNSDGPYNTTPTNPPSNIKGDFAYGIFSAHTVQRKTAVVNP